MPAVKLWLSAGKRQPSYMDADPFKPVEAPVIATEVEEDGEVQEMEVETLVEKDVEFDGDSDLDEGVGSEDECYYSDLEDEQDVLKFQEAKAYAMLNKYGVVSSKE